MATYSVNWSATLASTTGSVAVGTCLCMSSDGVHFAATSANRTSYGRTVGIAAAAGDASNRSVQMIEAGIVPPSITGLATGTVSWVRASSAGLLERCTPGVGDDIVGQCHADGSLQFMPGVWDSTNYAGGSGGGGTVPTGDGFVHITAGAQDAAATALTFTGDTTGTGTAASIALTTAKINGITISGTPAIGNQPVATSTSASAWAALNLAGGSGYVSGVLPTANQASQTMAGDVTGTTAASVVAKVNGTTYPAGGALTTGTIPRVTGVATVAYGALDLANASAVTGVLPSSHVLAGTCTPEMFGAVGDGVTSDQTAFADAFAAILAGTYHTLLLGAKTYLVTGTLLVTPGCSVIGQGPGSSIMKTTTDAMVFKLLHCNGTEIRGVGFLGNSTGINQNGIESGYLGSDGADRLIVDACIFTDMGGRGLSNAYGTGNSPGPTVSNCHAVNCGVEGFGAYSQMTFANCTARACAIGLHVAAGNIVFDGGDLSVNTIGLQVVGGGNGGHSIISSTLIDHCTSFGVDVAAGETNGMTFIGCHVYQSPLQFAASTGLADFRGCVIDPSSYTFDAASNVRFTDCSFPMGYTNTDNGVGDVEFVNARGTVGGLPAFIGDRIQRAFTFGSDADATLTAAESRCQVLDIQAGVITAARTITSALSASKGHKVLVRNGTAHAVTYLWVSGTGVTIAAGKDTLIGSDGTNAIALLTDGAVAGTTTQVIFNDGGSAYGGDAGLTYDKATDALSVAGSVNLGGGTVSTTGLVRLPYSASTTVIGVKDFSGTDRAFLAQTGADAWSFGGGGSTFSVQWDSGVATTWARSSWQIYSGSGGNNTIGADGAKITVGLPAVGDTAATSPYSVHGKTTVATTGSFTVAAADYAYDAIQFTSAAGGTVTFPLPADDAHAYYKTIIYSGNGTLVVTNTGGAPKNVSLASNTTQRLLFDTVGVHPVAAAIAYP